MRSHVLSVGLALAFLAGSGPARAQEDRGDEQEAREQQKAAQEDEKRQRDQEKKQLDQERRDREKEQAERQKERADERYERGTSSLDEGRWDRAVAAFDEVCRLDDSRCDGALYWKAYAQSRLGRRTEAQATLAELKKSHPQSRWLSEARALEQEVNQAAGKPASPGSADDEELKLLALNSLMNSDSERALPLLEAFLKTQRSPRLRDRALFVLSQSDSPRAREILLGIARGTESPDLQTRAVKYLGMSGDPASRKVLGEIYATGDVALRRQILQAFLVADDKARILEAARTEKAPELRREAIHLLGAMGAVPELQQIYKAETAPELRREILNSYVAADASSALIDAARSEKDASLRLTAVRNLGALDSKQTGPALVALYTADPSPEVRHAVLDAFTAQDNCGALVQIAKTEKDARMRRALVERLGAIQCKEATDFLLDILNK
ncbi:MAG TPA: HEAT repeat domain-containing protein [Vicinamibacteria bacterium]|nr:HEAT repeat domain-containing protein [Vicinamibacteria bacterium]